MTAHETRSVNEALLVLAEELTAEYVDIPAGSVLRCLARAVRHARLWGCPPEHLDTTAAATARWMLAERYSPGTSLGLAQLPA